MPTTTTPRPRAPSRAATHPSADQADFYIHPKWRTEEGQRALDEAMMAAAIGPTPATMHYFATMLLVGDRRYLAIGLEEASRMVLAAAKHVPPGRTITRDPPWLCTNTGERLGYVDVHGRCWWGEPGSSRSVVVYDPQQGGRRHG